MLPSLVTRASFGSLSLGRPADGTDDAGARDHRSPRATASPPPRAAGPACGGDDDEVLVKPIRFSPCGDADSARPAPRRRGLVVASPSAFARLWPRLAVGAKRSGRRSTHARDLRARACTRAA